VRINTPKRKDGSEHWVSAKFRDEKLPGGFTDEEILFKEKSNGNGIKSHGSCAAEHSLQYDAFATIKIGIPWREFDDDDLRGISRVAALIKSGDDMNEYDKMLIAAFDKEGYLKVENSKPILLIPFFEKKEYEKLKAVLEIIQKEAGEMLFASFIEEFASTIEKEIPTFVSSDERIYLKYQAYPQFAVLYWLSDNGLLRYPTDEEAKRLSTVVWCE